MPRFEDELAHPRELLRPCLLLLLAEEPGHGYDLMVRLKPFGFDWGGPGPIYRELRVLEEVGVVRSSWEAPGPGPARHVYELTDAGAATLARWASSLQDLGRLLDSYDGRFRALAAGARPPFAPAGDDDHGPRPAPPGAGGPPPAASARGGGRMRLRRR